MWNFYGQTLSPVLNVLVLILRVGGGRVHDIYNLHVWPGSAACSTASSRDQACNNSYNSNQNTAYSWATIDMEYNKISIFSTFVFFCEGIFLTNKTTISVMGTFALSDGYILAQWWVYSRSVMDIFVLSDGYIRAQWWVYSRSVMGIFVLSDGYIRAQ